MRSLLKAPRLSFDEKLAESTEAFIRDLHPKTRRQTNTMEALRYFMFCQQRKRKNESLSSTSDSLRQHMKRANYQTFIWRSSLVAIQNLQSPVGHEWELEDDCLKPVYMTKDPAPCSLIELIIIPRATVNDPSARAIAPATTQTYPVRKRVCV